MYLPITGLPGTMCVPMRHCIMHWMVRLCAPLSYISHLIGTSRWGMLASLLTLDIYANVACPHFPFGSCLVLVLHEISDMEWLSHVTIAFLPLIALSGEEWSQLPHCTEAVPDDVGPLQYPALQTLEISQNMLDVAEVCTFGYSFICAPCHIPVLIMLYSLHHRMYCSCSRMYVASNSRKALLP